MSVDLLINKLIFYLTVKFSPYGNPEKEIKTETET